MVQSQSQSESQSRRASAASHTRSRSRSRSSSPARSHDNGIFGDLQEEEYQHRENPNPEDSYDYDEISPKSIAAPSLRRPTVPDIEDDQDQIDMSDSSPPPPQSQSQSQSQSPSRAGSASLGPGKPSRISTLSSSPSLFTEHYSPSATQRPTMPDQAFVIQESAEYSPTAEEARKLSQAPFDQRRLYVERPQLDRGTSEQPLLNDSSALNTPLSNGGGGNPFDRPSASPHSSAESSDSDRLQKPKIHINSIPTSPAEQAITAFSSPEAGPSSLSDPSIGGGSIKEGGQSTSVESRIASIQARRSQRMKQKPKKESKRESKPPGGGLKRMPFQSTRLKGEIYKPWMEKKNPAQRWARWITIASVLIGLGAAGAICYDGYRAVPQLGKTCMVLDESFNTLDTSIWQREVRLDGYGNGEFEWSTASDNNSFTDNGILYLTPTLTSDHLGEAAITNGYTLNLTTDGTCTSSNVSQCAAVSNSSRLTVINPVMSARLTTKTSVNIKYGKVEVVAKFPTGDWLWPSIFMLPVNETYGAWPRSGEIDLLSGRGNNASYPTRGVDYAQSALHWGPTVDLDRLWMTWGYREQRRTYYNQAWHTFGLEWNQNYLWTYIDSRVSQVISLRFGSQSFWSRGNFPSTITNTTTGDVVKLINPWLSSENNVAPFDQPFYLVLSLAVGATNGWFPDGEGGKPWIDNSGTAMSDFWAAKDRWWNSWSTDPKVRGFAIDSVKMWKTC